MIFNAWSIDETYALRLKLLKQIEISTASRENVINSPGEIQQLKNAIVRQVNSRSIYAIKQLPFWTLYTNLRWLREWIKSTNTTARTSTKQFRNNVPNRWRPTDAVSAFEIVGAAHGKRGEFTRSTHSSEHPSNADRLSRRPKAFWADEWSIRTGQLSRDVQLFSSLV